MMNSSVFLLFSLLSIFSTLTFSTNVSHDGRALILDGQRRILLSGSIHYPRSTPQMWPDLIKKAKEGGLDAIETYVFWNAHEPMRRQYDFKGNLDIVRFLKTIQDAGLYAFLRIGPYVCAEWNYGGFPVWLHNIPGIQFRTMNNVFMNEMQNFTTFIVDMMKQENLFASQGGPIILAQIENEYGNIMEPYGDAGKAYINWCSKMAQSLNIGVPWVMCQQNNAPQPMINTCNGFYCDQFTPNNPNSPKMWTENWTGWFKSWGGKNPLRTAEDLAFAVARFFQLGGTFNNYYMYHGGTNFGRTAGGPYITTTYDYDAPLNEYGTFNQPKYGHLKQLHDVLHKMEKTLTYGNITSIDFGNNVTGTVYSTKDQKSCFLSNTDNFTDPTVNYQGVNYSVPAWSVSILPDCKTEIYNTAKVNTQTTKMVMKANEAESEPISLKWKWISEIVDRTVVRGKGQFSTNQILDQKFVNDTSDYMWYMTSLDLDKNDAVWSGTNMSLRVNATKPVLHAYVNGNHIGSQWASYDVDTYVFEKNVKLNPGKNQITLLSATVGLQNYGPFFDTAKAGLPGPIEIINTKGDESIIKDLSNHKWTYKVGLDGLPNQLSNENFKSASRWHTENLPINRMMTWYKTTFKPPLGQDPVVVYLVGLGKGLAWVNGHSLGRYWPSYIAQTDGCSAEPCDYRGSYSPDKCSSNCDHPSQRWYHVPRSFMDKDVNELVLFEELGGNPSLVNFQTVRPGTICGSAYEKREMELSCEGKPISDIKFASFGDVQGVCGNFQKGNCEAKNDALTIVRNACLGKENCSITASESVFGATNCEKSISKRLLVEAVC